jgi:hypothetical protein
MIKTTAKIAKKYNVMGLCQNRYPQPLFYGLVAFLKKLALIKKGVNQQRRQSRYECKILRRFHVIILAVENQ